MQTSLMFSTCPHSSSQLPLFSVDLTLEKEGEEDASDSEESVFSGLEDSGSDSEDEDEGEGSGEDLAVIDGPLGISSGAETPEKEDVQVAIGRLVCLVTA